MSLKILVGKPGSGKSYNIINRILSSVKDGYFVIGNVKLSKNTHIENYKYFDKTKLDMILGNIKVIVSDTTLSHDEMKTKLLSLFLFYCNGEVPKGYLFIIDEAHLNGFRGTTREIKWADEFISIHRHISSDFPFDILLVTQVISRINTTIASQAEELTQAVPATSRFSSGLLEYITYDDYKGLIAKDKMSILKRIVIKGNKDIFSMYETGYNEKGDNSFRRKVVLLSIGIALLMGYVFYSFGNLLDSKTYGGTKVLQESQSGSPIISGSQRDPDILVDPDAQVVSLDINKTSYTYYGFTCKTIPKGYLVEDTKYSYKYKENNTTKVCYKNHS